MKASEYKEVEPVLPARGFLWMELAQRTFSWAEEDFGPIDDKARLFIRVVEAVVDIREFEHSLWKGVGRKPASRLAMCKAFLYKMVYNIPTTKDLIATLRKNTLARRLCGWSASAAVPSEARFSIAFRDFAKSGFVERWHAKFIAENLGDVHVDTISYDSAPIPVRARAKSTKREIAEWDPDQPEAPSRIPEQFSRDARESLADLPRACDWGCKLDSQGKKKNWKGGKLHVAVTRAGIPVSWAYTSASLHDSQAMIPLAKLAAERVPHSFDLADAAYDSRVIRENSAELGMIAIIDVNRRWNGDRSHHAMTALEAKIYEQRTAAEQFFSHFLDAHGGRNVRVKTPEKIVLHIALGVLVVAVEQFARMTC